jgi:Asp-tRNA(Asn)/Glu-tRNA(Gln) amidotransferase A subunit family amidase
VISGVDKILYRTIDDLLQRIRAEEISPMAIANTCLARIDRLKVRLQRFVTALADNARARVRVAKAAVMPPTKLG